MEEGRAPKWGRTRSRAKKEKDATGEADNSKTNVYIEPDKEFPVKIVLLASKFLSLMSSDRIEMKSSQQNPSQQLRKPRRLHIADFETVSITDLYTQSLEMMPE